MCLPSDSNNFLCSASNEDFLVTDVIVSNDWNFAEPAKAGIIGLGYSSPIWNLIDVPNSNGTLSYSTQFSNATDWTFADPEYKPVSTGNSLTLTAGIITVPEDSITFKPTTSRTQLFTLSQFGFGTYNPTTLTESYSSILNSEELLYFSYVNQTAITMDLRGIGLPTSSYYVFANLMDIAS